MSVEKKTSALAVARGLPPLPTGWYWDQFANQCERVSVGHVGPTSDYFCDRSSGVPFIRSQDVRPGRLMLETAAAVVPTFHAKLKKSQLHPGDVLIVRVGANRGDCCVVPEGVGELNCANIVLARPRDRTGFYAYFFQSALGQELLLSATTGAAQGVINTSSVAAMPVPVVPASIQRRIAGILSAYDNLIENCERRIRVLDDMARALYREWFVLFRYPGHEKTQLVESSLGRIPKGWSTHRFDTIVRVHRGRSYRSSDLAEEGGVPFVNLKCIDRDGGFRRTGIKRFVGATPESHAVRPGDIVVAVTDMTQERRIVARAAFVPSLGADFGVLSMDLVRLEPINHPAAWVYAYLRYSTFADHLKQHANGANVLHLSPDRIREHTVLVPPEGVVNDFADRTAPMVNARDVLENRVENLRKTRDLLLPRLLSGQLSVEDAA